MSYLDYIRGQRCIACQAPPPNDPHHLLSGVMGSKGPDTSCIPLCRDCHRQYHNTSHAAFEQEHGFSRKRGLWYYAWRLHNRYHQQTDA